MTRRKPSPVNCVVRGRGAKGNSDSLKEVSRIEPLKKLLNSGLSDKDLEQIDISQPMLQSIRECARNDDKPGLHPEQTLAAVNSTLERLKDQIQDIDIQVQMLNLRKKALKRRSRILDRLAESFRNHQDQRWAA